MRFASFLLMGTGFAWPVQKSDVFVAARIELEALFASYDIALAHCSELVLVAITMRFQGVYGSVLPLTAGLVQTVP